MCRKQASQRLSQVYLMIRMLRMIFSLIIMVIYNMVVGKVVMAFSLTFVANYLLYLIFDSWFFCQYERRNARNDKMGIK